MSMKSVMKKASKYMLRSAHANKHPHGKAPCTPKKEPKPKPERAVETHWRAARKALDDAGRHFHDEGLKDAKTYKALKKKLAIAQGHMDKAQKELERANCG